MATTLAPGININNVSKGMNSLNTGLGNLKKSSDTIKTVTLNRTRIKRESFARDKILTNMREEAIRRKDQESVIEASGIGGAMKRTASVIGDSTKGFLGRILDFASNLLIGWLLYNLPTIMTAIEDLITRIKSLYGLLSDFMTNIKNTFENFGNLLSGVYQNVTQFDFTDQSKRVQSAMDELNINLETMHDQFMQGFDILKTPLGEGPGEEPVPELNTDYTQPGPTSGGDVSGYGTKEQQALLKTIRFAEGTAGSTGYSMFFGDKPEKSKYGDLTKLSANEVEKLVNKFLNDPQSRYGGEKSAAVGAFQIIDITAKARSLGMNMNRKFDQNFQDEMALRLAAARGVTSEVLKKEGLSETVIKKLSPEWASFPGNTYGQPTKRSQDLKSVYQSSLSSPTKPTQPSSPIPTAQVKSKPMVVTSGFGWRWGKQHQGIDLVTKTGKVEGTPVVIKKGGTVVYANIGGGNMGQVLITHDDGTQSRYLHVNSFQVRAGQKVNAGQTIANLAAMGASGIGNASGPHLHFEYYSSTRAGPSDPAGVYQNYVSLGGGVVPTSNPLDPNQQSRTASAQVTPPKPSAQVTPPKPPGQNVPSVAQNKKGQQIIIADNPQQPQPQQVSAGGGGSQPQMIPTESSLNSLIKNQILLELAYT